MRFTFLHAADLHLGSPLKGLGQKDADIAARFARAGRDAFSDLVTRAIDEPVAFVVIAGDIYDGPWKDTAIGLFFNREIARLTRRGIGVYMIRGNHDAESTVTAAVPLPEPVVLFRNRPHTVRIDDLNVALHGVSFRDRVVSDNLALTYPPAVPGWFNIGLLHTSLEGNAAHVTYAPCSVADLATRGYDYWALGHVHDHAVLSTDPHVVFPGNIQGRSIRETGPKGAVFVDVADGRVAGLRPVHVDRARWLALSADLSDVADEAGLRARLEALLAPALPDSAGRLLAVRVTLTGATPLHRILTGRRAAARDDIQAILHHSGEDIWLEKLVLATSDPDAAPELKGVGGLGTAGELLDGLADDPGLRALAADRIAQIAAKFPGDVTWTDAAGADMPPDVLIDGILADALALVRARAGDA